MSASWIISSKYSLASCSTSKPWRMRCSLNGEAAFSILSCLAAHKWSGASRYIRKSDLVSKVFVSGIDLMCFYSISFSRENVRYRSVLHHCIIKSGLSLPPAEICIENENFSIGFSAGGSGRKHDFPAHPGKHRAYGNNSISAITAIPFQNGWR